MHSFMDYLASRPLAVMAVAFVALFILYFIFKQLIKLALLLLLIAMAVGGYYYFKDPAKAPENIRQTLKDTRDKSTQLFKTGQHVYQKGKNLIDKSKEMTNKAADFLKKTDEKPEPEK